MMAINGVPRESKRRVLQDLEAREIITVDRGDRKSPVIKFISPWDALLRR
jgi:hypothetical protein